MIIKTEKIHTRNREVKSKDVKQHLKNYKFRKRCNLNRLIALQVSNIGTSGPRKQSIIFQYWTKGTESTVHYFPILDTYSAFNLYLYWSVYK